MDHEQYKAYLWLKGRVIAAIRIALADPKRNLSDAVLGAVFVIASHEYTYGDRGKTWQSHMRALEHMIARRGGPSALGAGLLCGLNAGLVLHWADPAQASCQAGELSLERISLNHAACRFACTMISRMPLSPHFADIPAARRVKDMIAASLDFSTDRRKRLTMLAETASGQNGWDNPLMKLTPILSAGWYGKQG